METKAKTLCPHCGSDDVVMVTEDVGLCRACREKVVLAKPACAACGSRNVEMVTETVGICKDCLEKVVIGAAAPAAAAPAAAAPEAAAPPPPAEIKTVSVLCPACGSNEVEMLNDEQGVCTHCRSTVMINKPQPITNVSNELHVHTSNADPQTVMSDYVINPDMDEKGFMRQALYLLACDRETPADIFSAEFEPVTSEYRFFSNVTSEVSLTYSAMIGIDRKEQYQEYDKSAGKYVTKTRTVTDWHPHNGQSVSMQSADVALDGKEPNAFCRTLPYIDPACIVKAEQAGGKIPAPKKPTQEDVEEAKRGCVKGAQYDARCNLPGDHNKDFNASGVATVHKIDNYTVTEYSMVYQYHYIPHTMHAFATRANHKWGDMVSDQKNTEKKVDEKSKKFYIISLVLVVLSIVASLVVRLYVVNIPCFLIAAGFFVFTEVSRIRHRKRIYKDNTAEKLRSLEKLLAEKELPALTENEKESIMGGKK